MIVEGWTEKVARRLSFVCGEVQDEEGTIYATAKGKFAPMSEEETRQVEELLIYDPDTLKIFDLGRVVDLA